MGTPLTWIDYSAWPTFQKSVDVYQDDALEWFEQIGCYDGADGSARSATGGVGHLINDAACLEAFPGGKFEYQQGEVRRYLDASEAADNCHFITDEEDCSNDVADAASAPAAWSSKGRPRDVILAGRDLRAGDELLRSYGANWWLGAVETRCLLVAQYARCEVRLLGHLRHSPQLLRTSRSLYDSALDRLAGLANEHARISETEPDGFAFGVQHGFAAFQGLGAYEWILSEPRLRRDYAQGLGDLDKTHLTHDERQDMLYLRSLSLEDYMDLFCAQIPFYSAQGLEARSDLVDVDETGEPRFTKEHPW
ncbi:hypothetical protein M885DRAFT_83468 [Pelagophyceae sp. CCMP2097]|nr:hypothetical protein M885DRAFT_83468 [Pelagophyceae sp. CCMP2097]|mmetsp:Transcript_18865/g.63751  ORF Transcript_18865/g.63751 Transcript_18865/m.63751 type:complete len:308 (-) Transcript_18865:58-981(-)